MKKIFANRKVRIFGIIPVVILIGLFKLTRPVKPAYSTTKVIKGSLSQTVSASGKITSEKIAQLAFQSSGKLNWVGIKEQDTVKQWQAIASLDTKSVQENIKKEMLAYMNQRWSFEQTQDDYKTDKNNLVLTDAEKRILEESQFNLDSSVADVEIADLAKTNATLVSPINGLVVQIQTPVASVNVTAGVVLFTIIDPSSVYFQAQVDELDIGKISLNQKVKINLDAYPDETFEGTVTKIAFAAIATSGGGTAFPVNISLPVNDQLKFKIGLNGDAEMIVKEEKDVLLIPNTAVFTTVSNRKFEVIGVAEKYGSMLGIDIDNVIYIPITTAQKVVGFQNLMEIIIKVDSKDQVDQAIKITKEYFLKQLKKDEFSVIDQRQLVNAINQILGVLTTALGGIAAISLVVGGIGIMNIMLVSVTERTREIGLRKALGATPHAILGQFLAEAVILSCGGGLIGVILGYLASFGLSQFIPASVPLWSVILSFVISASVGIIFGVAPAIRASRLDPITALRYE